MYFSLVMLRCETKGVKQELSKIYVVLTTTGYPGIAPAFTRELITQNGNQ